LGDRPSWWIERRHYHGLQNLATVPLRRASVDGAGSIPNQNNTPADEPRYDASTTVDIMVVVTDVKDVAKGKVLSGTHLIVLPETAKAGSETTDVYLAPSDYLRGFECHFAKGDRVQVKGSKVKYNGGTVILAREVRLDSTTVYLRDPHGVPYWVQS
jgi:hypothetical protein